VERKRAARQVTDLGSRQELAYGMNLGALQLTGGGLGRGGELPEALDLVPPEFHADRALSGAREDVEDPAPHR
jgi:hypothetical protein